MTKCAQSGFDVMLGNPPWEHVELKEKEWFATRQHEISDAKTGAIRKKMIRDLAIDDDHLFHEYQLSKRVFDCIRHFLLESKRYTLCGRGRVNFYAVFAELFRDTIGPRGRSGCLVPSGIATDDTTKLFFQSITGNQCLVSLFDFENREHLFSDVDSRMKFCALTLSGIAWRTEHAQFAFFAHKVEDLADPYRVYTLSANDIQLLNPNTFTCPVFRSQRDRTLVLTIYQNLQILWNESQVNGNLWGFTTKPGLFNMTQDSKLFFSAKELIDLGANLVGNKFLLDSTNFVPLYEGKMVSFYDHRHANVVTSASALIRKGQSELLTQEEHFSPFSLPQPRYWVEESEMEQSLGTLWRSQWLFGWKQVTSPTNERTLIPYLIPRVGIGHSLYVAVPNTLPQVSEANAIALLLANLSSYVCDYIVRQKLGGVNLTPFTFKQLPVVNLKHYLIKNPLFSELLRDWFLVRTNELVYSSFDMESFGEKLK